MAFSLFLSFFERLNNSECDRPSLNLLPLVCVLFRAHELCNFLVMVATHNVTVRVLGY